MKPRLNFDIPARSVAKIIGGVLFVFLFCVGGIKTAIDRSSESSTMGVAIGIFTVVFIVLVLRLIFVKKVPIESEELAGGGHTILSQRNIGTAIGKIHIGGFSLDPSLVQAVLGVAPTKVTFSHRRALGFVDTAPRRFWGL